MKEVRVGIIGIGNRGSGELKTVYGGEIKGMRVTAVCDIDPAKLEWAKELCGNDVNYYDDADKLMESGDVDAVMIAAPHYFHPVMGMKALDLGLHVLSEKPIGVYTSIIRDWNKKAEEKAKEKGLVFGIMYNQRTNPLYQMVREMIQSGELGTPKRLIWIITDWYRTQSYYNSSAWRATWALEGGGVLINQCPHNIDLWQWMFGMPKRLRANCYIGKYHDIEVEDDVTVYAEYENGATATFITTTGEAPGTNRLEIACDNGKVVIEDGKGTYWKLKTPTSEHCKNFPDGFAKPEYEVIEMKPEGVETAHKGITQNFTNAILHGEKLLAPGVEGINGLMLSNAMMLSGSQDGAWVDLPVDEEAFNAFLAEKVKHSKVKPASGSSGIVDLEGTY